MTVFGLFHPYQQIVPADAGIVHQHLDIVVRMGLLPVPEALLCGGSIGHIEFQERSLPFNQGQALLRGLVIGNIIDKHMVAHLVQLDTDRPADSPTAARY